MSLSIFTVSGSYVPRYGYGVMTLLAPNAATALKVAAESEQLINDAVKVTVEWDGYAYCDHTDATGTSWDNPSDVWTCDACGETHMGDEQPEPTASTEAFKIFCDMIANGPVYPDPLTD